MVTREVGRDWALTISGRDDERKKERERENFRNRPHRFIVDRRRRGASLIFNSTERERERATPRGRQRKHSFQKKKTIRFHFIILKHRPKKGAI